MFTNEKFQPTGKQVLLFSGGMDSLMFDYFLKPDVLLYLPSGSSFEEVETKRLHSLVDNGYIDKDKLVIFDDVLNLKMFERDDYIVPNRNAFYLLVASMLGETLILGSVSGDRSNDKDETFFTKINELLDYMWKEQHWTEERNFKVISPYKDKTKTELVKDYLDNGGSSKALIESYSCYSGNETLCGTCKPCFRKWIALYNNDIEIPDGYYTNEPTSAEWLHRLMKDLTDGTYRGKEDADWINALKKKNVFDTLIEKYYFLLARGTVKQK
jgi:7-cyano-7-deazaguanine synthase in queuosine biosynthesis